MAVYPLAPVQQAGNDWYCGLATGSRAAHELDGSKALLTAQVARA